MGVAIHNSFEVHIVSNCEITSEAIHRHLNSKLNNILTRFCGVEIKNIRVNELHSPNPEIKK